nr:CaiB/BaiF CoA-transferase family protein [Chelatococcus sp. HY11]
MRIVELDAIGPVPMCAMLLADMGADIVRIARAGGQVSYDDVGGSILHRSRTDIVLNLKEPAGRDAALALIEKAEVLIEGLRPGVMERLGLGPDVCLGRQPTLVYGRMTGWGQDGTLSSRAGHDINYIAVAGALAAIGERGRTPIPPLNLVGDYGAGAMMLAVGVLAALTEARRSGIGQVVDAAMSDGTPLLMALFHALRQNGGWNEQRQSNMLDGGVPFYRCYACSDGGYMSVGALEPQFFAELLAGLGLDPADYPQNDVSGHEAMADAFADRFLTRSRDEWTALFEDRDACVYPVLSMSEAVEYRHNRSRKTFVEHAGIIQPAPAPRFSRTQSVIGTATSCTFEDVLARWSAEAN